jgi:hypothetical protein
MKSAAPVFAPKIVQQTMPLPFNWRPVSIGGQFQLAAGLNEQPRQRGIQPEAAPW